MVKVGGLLVCCLPSPFPVFVLEGASCECEPRPPMRRCLRTPDDGGPPYKPVVILREGFFFFFFSPALGTSSLAALGACQQYHPSCCGDPAPLQGLTWPQGTKDQNRPGNKSVLPPGSVPFQASLQTAGTMTRLSDVREN